MSYSKITLEKKDDNIYYLGFGKYEDKSMNVIYEQTLKEIDMAMDEVALDKEAKGLILFSYKDNCFFAGMDISVIEGLSSEAQAIEGCEAGHAIFNKLEDLKIPTIALVDGTCLGGGLEMILACDKIVASNNSKTAIGLPEVMIGVLPGFGGTYRLPKRVGLTKAMDMILTGRQIRHKKALKMGLVDYVVPKERLMTLGKKYLFEKKVNKKSFKESLTDSVMNSFLTRKLIFQKAREKVLKTTKGFYPAPLKILDHLESSFGDKRARYLAKEAKAFGELSQTKQSKNLQHVFFLHDGSKKLRDGANPSVVSRGAVLGAGTMGGGIAWLFAKNNQAPIMKDISKEGLELGLKQSSSVFKKALKRRRMSKDDFERLQRSISAQLDYNGFKAVDLVIEAVVENMNVKKAVFKELEGEVTKNCILTSNTSSLSIEQMATALEDSSRFAGLHFFNPVNKMPLVEIIKHKNVSDETIDTLYKWTLKVGKTPVVVNDCPGFLVNRILAPFLNEAAFLMEEGVSIKDLDKAAVNFGMPMGPARLMDEVGIDVCSHVGEIMEEGLGERAKASKLSDKCVQAQLLGKKNQKGFYLYDEAGKQLDVNPKVQELLPSKKVKMDEVEIQKRLILPMINEAASILDEGIVDNPGDVDLGLIFGIGFPPFRGGLLKYADSEGLDRILESIKGFSESVSDKRYGPMPYLEKLVSEGKTFYN
ncbi:MAG: 3-hydroxyacyl-CoA dehydrogenase NAD-binding domain-containing protein [Bacteriovoracaceae bacterium]|nr:3-hydroxyacyl-CoA dehydrogenase NAD-binding domain-containing protein [Bacteriovoracaceae bacterium]